MKASELIEKLQDLIKYGDNPVVVADRAYCRDDEYDIEGIYTTSHYGGEFVVISFSGRSIDE